MKKEAEGLKIISLDISNIKKVKAFKMQLDGGNLHIAGDVSEGKTTAINALWDILTKSQDSITHGERKGIIKVKLAGGDKTIFAERVTSKGKSGINSTLRIFNENGDPVSAKEFNQMISGLAVNPHKIKDMLPGEQVQALLKSAKVEGDIPQLDRDIFTKEQERLDANRDMDKSKPTGDIPAKAERVNISELLTQLDEAEAVNKDNQDKRDKLAKLIEDRKRIDSDIEGIKDSIADLEAQLSNTTEQRRTVDERIGKGEAVVTDLKDADTESIRASIGNAEATNDMAISYESWVKADNDFKAVEKLYHDIVEDVKNLKDKKKQALEGAQWPIDGLAIVDGQIYYNDCLMDNLGESEQMLVCAALAMNDILAHEIRVVRMDGVESMSEAHMQKLTEIFNGHGIQVLSTRVSRGEVAEGEIKIIDGQYREGTDEV